MCNKNNNGKIFEKSDGYFTPKKNLTLLKNLHSSLLASRVEKVLMNFSLDYKDYDFASLQNSLLRDMIIIDILDKRLQACLLRESDITFENTIKHCQASEVTKKHVKILQHQAAPASVAKISTKKVRTSKSHAKRAKKGSLSSASSLVIAIKEVSV